MTDATSITNSLQGARTKAVVLGVVALGISLIGLLVDHQEFFVSYLEAYLFWLGITLGCLGILMINNLVAGSWGVLVRCFLEAGSSLIPFMAVFFAPIVVWGMHDLYIWTHADIVAANPILRQRQSYMNVSAFAIRAVVFFLIWSVIRWWIDPNPLLAPTVQERQRLQRRSGIGILVCGYSISIAAMDWVMSIHATWYSNMFGLIFVVGEMLTAMAFVIVMVVLIKERMAKADFPIQSFHDASNLLLVFVLFWSYISFSQYLIIWCAQIPEEFLYYNQRAIGLWKAVSFGLIMLHFALPFALLLQRRIKRKTVSLMKVALFILFMRCVDVVWWIAPVYYQHVFRPQWCFVAVLIGIGGVWMWAFLGRLDAARVMVVPLSAHGHHGGGMHPTPMPSGPQDRPHGERR